MIKCDEEHLWTVWDRNLKRVRVIDMKKLVEDGYDRYLIPSSISHGWMRIKSVDDLPQEPVRCIRVEHKTHSYELRDKSSDSVLLTHNTGGGKSVAQRNIVDHIITHSKEIKMLAIDLKRVELSAYKPYTNAIIGVATTLEDAIEVLRFAQETMMDRYGDMEAAGHNNFLDMENAGSALMVMVDEAGELLDTSSPAKALAASTIVPNLEDRRNLGEIKVGDHVVGDDGEWHRVIEKYEPLTSEAYRVTVKRDSDDSTEDFTCGAQHSWTVYPSGGDDEPLTVTTDQLMSIWESTPESERKNIKFKRSSVGNALNEINKAE
jgi:hypothetical protein